MTLLNVQEAAALLRLKPCTVYTNKSIPRTKLPGIRAVLFDKEDLVKWAKGLLTPSLTTATIPLSKQGVDMTPRYTYNKPLRSI